MTPTEKIRKPATEENYDITDLHSEDSTDDESKPRKKIPLWAQGQIHSFIWKIHIMPPQETYSEVLPVQPW